MSQETPSLEYERSWLLAMSVEVWRKSIKPIQQPKKEKLKEAPSLVSNGYGTDYASPVVAIAHFS